MRKRKHDTYILRGSGGRELVLDVGKLRTLTTRLRAKFRSPPPYTLGSCSFTSLGDFDEDDDDSDDEYNSDYLCARQLVNIGCFLRKAILKHRWNEVACLTQLLCNPGIFIYKSTIISTCLLLLINHPNSNRKLLEKFIRDCTGYILPEEIRKFITILFAIREEPLTVLTPGKYVRTQTMYKAVDEVCFGDLLTSLKWARNRF